jgi:hypothetical protein
MVDVADEVVKMEPPPGIKPMFIQSASLERSVTAQFYVCEIC